MPIKVLTGNDAPACDDFYCQGIEGRVARAEADGWKVQAIGVAHLPGGHGPGATLLPLITVVMVR